MNKSAWWWGEFHCFCPLFCSSPQVPWKGLEKVFVRTSQLHLPWCDSCIYPDVAMTSTKDRKKARQAKRDYLWVTLEVEVEVEEARARELDQVGSHPPPKNQQKPSDQQTTSGMSQMGSPCEWQGDRNTLWTVKADQGKDKYHGNGHWTCMYCTKRYKHIQKTSTTINLF